MIVIDCARQRAQQPVRQVNPDQSVSILTISPFFNDPSKDWISFESRRNFNIDSCLLFRLHFLYDQKIAISIRAKMNLDNLEF